MRIVSLVNNLVNNKVFRHGVLFSFFSFLNNGISFLLILVLAKYFTPSEYGYLNLFTTLVTVFSLIISLNTLGFLSISFFNSTKEELQQIVKCILIVSLLVFSFFFIVIFIFSGYSLAWVGVGYQYQIIALLICLFQAVNNLKLEIWRLEEKPVSYGIYSLALVLLNSGLTLYFVVRLHMGWEGRVYSFFGVTGLFFITSLILLFKQRYIVNVKLTKIVFKQALSYGLPLIPHSLSTWIRQGGDRYIINLFLGIDQVGYFSFSFNIYNIVLMIGAAFNATNSVNIFKCLAEKNHDTERKLRKQIKIMSIFFVILSFIIWGGCCLSIPLWFPQYKPAIQYLFPLVMAGLFQCLYLLFVNFLFFYKKTKKLMYITVSVSVIHLLLSFALTRFGMIYTAYITMIGNFIIFFLVMLYARKFIIDVKDNA